MSPGDFTSKEVAWYLKVSMTQMSSIFLISWQKSLKTKMLNNAEYLAKQQSYKIPQIYVANRSALCNKIKKILEKYSFIALHIVFFKDRC